MTTKIDPTNDAVNNRFTKTCQHLLFELRTRSGLNAKEFARRVGTTASNMGYYLKGDRPPNLGVLMRAVQTLPGATIRLTVDLPAWEDMGMPERSIDLTVGEGE